MDSSHPYILRVEAFKLTQSLVRLEEGWLIIARAYCESFVKAILDGMGGWNLCTGKVANDQVPLLAEACKLAFITRWGGEHHMYFWKFGVDRVLLNLLVDNFYRSEKSQVFLSVKELIATARTGLDANYREVLRPYIWAILGWLATHCPENFTPNANGNSCLDGLITCACFVVMDTLGKGHWSSLDVEFTSKLEPACRAVLLMVHSSCKYIASRARDILSELPTPNVEAYLRYVIGSISSTKHGPSFNVVNKDQTVIGLIVLSCLSALPMYHRSIIQSNGILILLTFTTWCLSNNADVAPCSQSTYNYNYNYNYNSTCCMSDREDWEGRDTLLFFSLWGLAELIKHSVDNHDELISNPAVGSVNIGGSAVQTLVDKLQIVSGSTSNSPGLRWRATYVLSFFGFYGSPSRFGKRVGKGLCEKDLADIYLKLSNGECLKVHGVILMVRCPSMLPSGESCSNETMYDGPSTRQQQSKDFRKEICLSARVDHTTLMKLLDYVYTGFVQVDGDLVKRLKMLSRSCGIRSLSHQLSRKCPKWGATVPCCDFTPALGPYGYRFSDVILEAKGDEMVEWSCTNCSLSLPHIHVHKIILWLSCDYFRALFQSGMQESHSQTIKVPVSWRALSKLISWFYSDELPKPCSGCIWDNMEVERQLQEVHPYVELCWLAEFWLLDDFREDTLRIVISCLRSSRNLSFKIIQVAAELSQWEIVEVAANCLAPLYPHLRDSGDLGSLNEEVVDMVRVAYVQLSQAGD